MMQAGACEWVERPGGEPLCIIFGTTAEGTSGAVVVRGVRPRVEILVKETLSVGLKRELSEILNSKHPHTASYENGALVLTFAGSSGVEAVARVRPPNDLSAYLANELGPTLPLRERRPDPCKCVLKVVKPGDWITVPPWECGVQLHTNCAVEGSVFFKDLAELKQPSTGENAPRRVLAYCRTEWGSHAVVLDAGAAVYEDAFRGLGDLCTFFRRADPDIVLVASSNEADRLAKAAPPLACAFLSRARFHNVKCPFAGRAVVEVAHGSTPRELLAHFMKSEDAPKHFVATKRRSHVKPLGWTPHEDAARERRMAEDQQEQEEHSKKFNSLSDALTAAYRGEVPTELWTDPVNNTQHPVYNYNGRRVFVLDPQWRFC